MYNAETAKRYRERNRDRLRAYNTEYVRARRAKTRRIPLKVIKAPKARSETPSAVAQRKFHANSWRKFWSGQLKYKYGIDADIYDDIVNEQGGRCAICSGACEGKHRHLDHCHDTGRVRGILCSKCNVALGLLRDDPNFIMSWSTNASCYLLSGKNYGKYKGRTKKNRSVT